MSPLLFYLQKEGSKREKKDGGEKEGGEKKDGGESFYDSYGRNDKNEVRLKKKDCGKLTFDKSVELVEKKRRIKMMRNPHMKCNVHRLRDQQPKQQDKFDVFCLTCYRERSMMNAQCTVLEEKEFVVTGELLKTSEWI